MAGRSWLRDTRFPTRLSDSIQASTVRKRNPEALVSWLWALPSRTARPEPAERTPYLRKCRGSGKKFEAFPDSSTGTVVLFTWTGRPARRLSGGTAAAATGLSISPGMERPRRATRGVRRFFFAEAPGTTACCGPRRRGLWVWPPISLSCPDAGPHAETLRPRRRGACPGLSWTEGPDPSWLLFGRCRTARRPTS